MNSSEKMCWSQWGLWRRHRELSGLESEESLAQVTGWSKQQQRDMQRPFIAHSRVVCELLFDLVNLKQDDMHFFFNEFTTFFLLNSTAFVPETKSLCSPLLSFYVLHDSLLTFFSFQWVSKKNLHIQYCMIHQGMLPVFEWLEFKGPFLCKQIYSNQVKLSRI